MRRGVALVLVVLFALVAAGCGGGKRNQRAHAPTPSSASPAARDVPETSLSQAERYRQNQDGEPPEKIDVSTIPEPVPVDEPPSRYGNRSPYSVLGQTYRVLPTSRGYVERGISSWYGNKFHGYMTSSFEPYDMYKFTAAHKSLPLPSWARVTNLQNGKSVVVRVNDRGPFHDNRLIDLSYAAAVKIGVWPKGTGLVEVRALEPGEPEPAPTTVAAAPRTAPRQPPAARPPAAAQPAPVQAAPVLAAPAVIAAAAPAAELDGGNAPRIYLQVGAYGEVANAERAARTVESAGFGGVRVVDAQVNGKHVRRVRIGPLKDADEADRLTGEIRKLGLGEARVAID
jgi:rare lipoprotein A